MRLYAKQTVYDSLIDRSGTVASVGVSQLVCAKTQDRCYFLFQNISTQDIWGNWTSAAAIGVAGSFRIAPGEVLALEGSFVTSEAFYIIGSVSGQQFTCKENSPSYGNFGQMP